MRVALTCASANTTGGRAAAPGLIGDRKRFPSSQPEHRRDRFGGLLYAPGTGALLEVQVLWSSLITLIASRHRVIDAHDATGVEPRPCSPARPLLWVRTDLAARLAPRDRHSVGTTRVRKARRGSGLELFVTAVDPPEDVVCRTPSQIGAAGRRVDLAAIHEAANLCRDPSGEGRRGGDGLGQAVGSAPRAPSSSREPKTRTATFSPAEGVA